MQFNNGKCFLFHHYQNKKDRNPRSMQEQSRGCRFTFPPCLYIIPRVETQVLPSRVHARAFYNNLLLISGQNYINPQKPNRHRSDDRAGNGNNYCDQLTIRKYFIADNVYFTFGIGLGICKYTLLIQ